MPLVGSRGAQRFDGGHVVNGEQEMPKEWMPGGRVAHDVLTYVIDPVSLGVVGSADCVEQCMRSVEGQVSRLVERYRGAGCDVRVVVQLTKPAPAPAIMTPAQEVALGGTPRTQP